MSEIDDLRRRVARLEAAAAGYNWKTLPGLFVPCNPRKGIITDGSALAVGTYDYTVTSYGIPGGVLAVSLSITAKWASASTSSVLHALLYGSTTEVYGIASALVAGAYQTITAIVPVVENKIRIKVNGADTSGTYIMIAGYIR